MCDLPDDFFEKLSDLYQKSETLKQYWDYEEPVIRKLLPEVAKDIAFNYCIIEPIGVGGGGIVLTVHDHNLDTTRALKISRPSPGKELLLADILDSEQKSLRRLAHQNLIRIFAQGKVSLNGNDYPYYIMEYVEGVLDADTFLERPDATEQDLLRIIDGTLAAVEYMHSQQTIHMDLKPGNILVLPNGMPIVSDLGFAKMIKTESGVTLIGGTEGFIHPEARKLVQEAHSDPNRLRGKAERRTLKPQWDLYSLGKTFLILVNAVLRHNTRSLSPYTRRYVKLLACRLLDGYNSETELALGLAKATFEEIKYASISDARIDFLKLTGEYNLSVRVPELNLFVQDTIQASTLAITPFTERVRSLIDQSAMKRLGACTQLGLLNFIYITAKHTRLEHSIGTFSVLCRYVRALYNDPLNPLFKQLMNEEDLRASLLVAILHDVGQFPLAHDLEEADDASFSHSELTIKLLSGDDSELADLLRVKESEGGWGIEAKRVIDILESDPASLRGTLKDRILHSLIDGPIDADKLDYLKRDSLHLGLRYGEAIDIDRLLRCLTIVTSPKNGSTYASLGIHEKGKIPAEAVAFARYSMFGQVYWHHAYRSIKVMIHRIVWEMLDVAGSDKDRTNLRRQFREFVSPNEFLRTDEELFETVSDVSDSQIDRADQAVLRWLAKRAGSIGEELYWMLQQRKLFKRIIVIGHDRHYDRVVWEKADEFFRPVAGRWKAKLRLQREFQERLAELVEEPTTEPQHTAIITPSARNAFISAARNSVLVLVDFPSQRRKGETQLQYIVEEDRKRSKIDEMRTASLEDSVIWRVLQKQMRESICRLRVYCQPDHAEFLSAFLSRETIENALSETMTRIDRDQ